MRESQAETGRLPHEIGAGGGPKPSIAALRDKVAEVVARPPKPKKTRAKRKMSEDPGQLPPSNLGPMSNPPGKFDKQAWQRQHMRERRARERAEKEALKKAKGDQ